MKIVFMGTPEFAVSSLDILVQNGYEIVGVITVPDKPAGRGHKLQQSAVKKYALEHNLPVLQPEKLKDPVFIEQLQALNADLQVVVAFRMLPAVVFQMPRYGTFNLHASLLPQYRGAAPINWAVINGDTESGVTTFFIEQQIDTGNIIFQEKTPIAPNQTAGELHDVLMDIGAKLVLKTVQAIEAGNCTTQPQPNLPDLRPAPKIFTETCRINWQQPTAQVYNFVRGLSPYPAAFTTLHDKILKIYQAKPIIEMYNQTAGTFVTDQKTYLHIATADGWIEVLELQMEGKKRMGVQEFLRGNKV
ncbi:MAG: methionyl-tRNA formyltransferase [Sphingobacteriales bacterium]|nr:methionyl-tRNA formyltransferase [Sphingobacteriales bacterium]